jgi:uncharacterized membrane protein YdcZ (DUF606 family)
MANTQQKLKELLRDRLHWAWLKALYCSLKARNWAIIAGRKAATFLDASAVTLSVLAVGSVLFGLTDVAETFSDQYSPEAVLVQVAATLGTILAIVFGLAILPVQRAAEALSPAILRLYARDWRARFVFGFLGVACVMVFLVATKGIGTLPSATVFLAALLILALCIDLLRWFNRLIVELLDPIRAVNLATEEVKRVVLRVDKLVDRIAAVMLKTTASMPDGDQADLLDIKGMLLQNDIRYAQPVNYWLEELGEIARKAAGRAEKRLAAISVSAISQGLQYYLEVRRDNLRIGVDPTVLLATTNNAKLVLQPAMETLIEVARTAIRLQDDDTALAVAKAYANVAIFAANLAGMKLEKWRGSLTSDPVSYLCRTLREGREAKLRELPFQGADELKRIAMGFPPKGERSESLSLIIEELANIAGNFYARLEPALAEEVVSYLAEMYAALLRDDAYLDREILSKVNALAPLAIVSHTSAGLQIVNPLGGAYSLARPSAFPHALERLLADAKFDPERAWVNPYHDFIEVVHAFQQSVRTMAEQVEFGSSMLLWELNQDVHYLTEVIAKRCAVTIQAGHAFEDALANETSWLLSILWVAFHKKKHINEKRAEECCDTQAAAAIRFLSLGHPGVAFDAVSSIGAITESLLAAVPNASEYAIGDCLARLDYIRLAAEHIGNAKLVAETEARRKSKLEGVTDARRAEIQAVIDLRVVQLQERLSERGYRTHYQHAESVLDEVLRKPGEKGQAPG